MKLQSFGAFNAMVPNGGPKFIPLNLDFTNGVTSRNLDFVLDEMLTIMEYVQGVFIDNSNGTQPVIVSIANSQQIIRLQPGWQGYFPIFVPNSARITIQSASDIYLPVIFYNVALPSAQWPGGITGSLDFDAGGALIVSDQVLDAIVSDIGDGPALSVNALTGLRGAMSDANGNPTAIAFVAAMAEQFNGTTWERKRGNVAQSAISSASRASGSVTNSADIVAHNAKGINIITNISAGAGDVTVKLQVKDPVSNLYADVPGAVTTALTGVSTNLLQVGPGITPAANLAVAALLGRTLRIVATAGGGVNTTFSVGVDLLT